MDDLPQDTFEQTIADDYAIMWNLLRRVAELALSDKDVYRAYGTLFDEIIAMFQDDSEGE